MGLIFLIVIYEVYYIFYLFTLYLHPIAITGGIWAFLITGTHFSISAGIGFIALFGICIQDGVLLITVFKQNLEKVKGQTNSIYTSIKLGVDTRIRPVMMTALMAAISTSIGSVSSRPLARVVIGGILCAMVFYLLVFPLIFGWAYRNVDTKHKGEIDEKIRSYGFQMNPELNLIPGV